MITQTLDTVVREYMVLKGEESLQKYRVYLQAAIKGLKEMHYDVSGVPKVVVIDTTDSGQAILPPDVIRVIRMGFLNSAGEFTQIYTNNNLVVNIYEPNGCASGETGLTYVDAGAPVAPQQADFYSGVRNGQIIGRDYGNVGGGAFTYRMDWARGLIEFSSNVSGQVVIEYLSDPTKINGEYTIHPFLVEPVQAFIEYATNRHRKGTPAGEKAYAFSEYVKKKRHAQLRFMSEGMGEMINASRKTFSQTIKM